MYSYRRTTTRGLVVRLMCISNVFTVDFAAGRYVISVVAFASVSGLYRVSRNEICDCATVLLDNFSPRSSETTETSSFDNTLGGDCFRNKRFRHLNML